MTQGVPSSNSATGQPQRPDENKIDVPEKPKKSGVLDIDGKPSVVKKLAKKLYGHKLIT